MRVAVNGEPREIAAGTTVEGLLSLLALSPSRVAVERNRAIVRRADFGSVSLEEGDRLEIVTFVGGG